MAGSQLRPPPSLEGNNGRNPKLRTKWKSWKQASGRSTASDQSLLRPQAQSSKVNGEPGQNTSDPDDHGFQARSPNSRGTRPQDSHGVWRKESARPSPKTTGAPETAKEVGLSPDNPRHGPRSGIGRPWGFDTEINDAVVENALPRGRGRGAGPLDNGSGIHRGSSGFLSRPAPARSVGSRQRSHRPNRIHLPTIETTGQLHHILRTAADNIDLNDHSTVIHDATATDHDVHQVKHFLHHFVITTTAPPFILHNCSSAPSSHHFGILPSTTSTTTTTTTIVSAPAHNHPCGNGNAGGGVPPAPSPTRAPNPPVPSTIDGVPSVKLSITQLTRMDRDDFDSPHDPGSDWRPDCGGSTRDDTGANGTGSARDPYIDSTKRTGGGRYADVVCPGGS
ncbi:hypothetical protein B0T18DRAFT_388084 [Schizothecium vesticola]|uniref:Uncharacterized protein n=1 Tax=Schizothecium vesticola TaxID=314040 RepID=A0AA40KAH7_9PEZI|nr:hypothetical protein B0T18DRAFT_388084 [Schizothecium vesticola]